MFLAMKELMHNKMKFLMIIIIFVLMAWLVFILSGLGNGLSTLAASTFKTMKADYVIFEEGASVFHEQVTAVRSTGGEGGTTS